MLSHSPEGSICFRIYQVSNDTKPLTLALGRRLDFNIMVYLVRQLITVYFTHEICCFFFVAGMVHSTDLLFLSVLCEFISLSRAAV